MSPSASKSSSSSSSSSLGFFLPGRSLPSEHMQAHMMVGHGHSCHHNHHHFHKRSKHGGPKKMKGARLSAASHHPHQCIPPKHLLKPYKKLLKHARKLHKKKACRPFNLYGLCPFRDLDYHHHHSPSCCLHYPLEHPCAHAGSARPRCHGRSSSPPPGAEQAPPETMEAAPPVQPDEAGLSKALKELSTEGA